MSRIHVHKAQPTGDEVTADTTIEIGPAVPTWTRAGSLEALDRCFMEDARALEAALYDHLPGGTYDRLLGLMLERKASHFIVAHNA